jgi:WD40 repeat protein
MAEVTGEVWAIHAVFKESKEKLPTCFMHPDDIVADLRRSLAERGVSERCNGNSLAVEFGDRLRNRQLQDWETIRDTGLHHGAVIRVWANPLRLLVTASFDGTAKVWNTVSGECLQTLAAGATAESLDVRGSIVKRVSECHSVDKSPAEGDGISHMPSTPVAEDMSSIGPGSPLAAGDDRSVQRDEEEGSVGSFPSDSMRSSSIKSDVVETPNAPAGAIVSEAVFSCVGDTIMTAADSNVAKLWNASTGECTLTLTGHKDRIRCASFSPDAKSAVTASDDNTAVIWDTFTGEKRHILSAHGHYVRFACFSPDGDLVLTASLDKDARTWDTATGECLQTLSAHRHFIRTASWSSCSGGIATASSDKTARIWSASTGECLETCQGHEGTVYSAVFSPDGHQLLTASYDCTAKLWNVMGGECIRTLTGHGSIVANAQFSHIGERIVTCSYDFTAKVWKTASGECIHTLHGHRNNVVFATFTQDDDSVVTTSFDTTTKMWNSRTGQCIHNFQGHKKPVVKADLVPW